MTAVKAKMSLVTQAAIGEEKAKRGRGQARVRIELTAAGR
jgi:hypothetical protein